MRIESHHDSCFQYFARFPLASEAPYSGDEQSKNLGKSQSAPPREKSLSSAAALLPMKIWWR